MAKEEQARKKLFEEVQSMYLNWSERVLVQACTGSGKCKIALDLMKPDLEKGDPLDIVVPQDVVIKTWEREIVRWGYDKYNSLINIYCNKSLHKHQISCNTIFDECHMVTELMNKYLKPKTYTHKLIGLSATVSFDKIPLLNDLGLGAHNSVMYSLDDGVKDGIIVPYQIKVISIPIDGSNKKVEVKMKKGGSFYTTELEQYKYLTNKIGQLETDIGIRSLLGQDVTTLEVKLKTLRLVRMRAVYNFPSKQLGAQYILNLIPKGMKLIGFCGGIPQCNALFKKRYHSKTDKTDLEDFSDGKFDKLGTVSAANMGINVPGLMAGLIVQVQSKFIHLVQRAGRTLRLDENDPNKTGIIYILVSRNTVDENEWVVKALKNNLDTARITYLQLEDIIADNSLLLS